MAKIKTLEEALKRIEELERENEEMREELEYLRKKKDSGRKRHNAQWTATYNDVVTCLGKGMTVFEIAERNNISVRSVYRYKKYYDSISGDKKT